MEGVELPLPKASKEGPLGILQAWRKKEGSERKAEPQTRESSLVFSLQTQKPESNDNLLNKAHNAFFTHHNFSCCYKDQIICRVLQPWGIVIVIY